MPKIDRRRLVGVGALPEQFRTLDFEVRQTRAPADDAPALYEIAVSTEAEIERWYGVEVLEHSKSAIDFTRLKRGAAVLVDHRGDQVGVIENARLDDDKVLRAEIRFSRSTRGQEIERDVADGIRQSVSVGYFVKKAKLVETRDGGVDVWKITRWQPAEVSIVSVPADVMAGVGRSESEGRECPVELEHEETRVMKKVMGDNGAVIEVDDSDPRPAVREQAPAVTVGPDAEAKRTEAIRALCKAANMVERTADFLASALTVEQVAARIEAARATTGAAQPSAEQVVAGLDPASRKRYSYHRALRNAWAALEGKGKLDGVEGEMHAELERNWPKGATRKGQLLIPMDLRTDDERLELMYQRTATSFGATKGVETVFQQYGQLIDMLRNRTKVIQAGAMVMTGLTGPVGFPKLTGGPSVEWAPEDPATGTTQSDLAWGIVQLAGKTLRGLVGFTRQFMAQSSVDAEGVTRAELSFGHSLAIDRGALHGLGSSGQPQGLYRIPGVNTEAYAGAPAYADLVDQVIAIFADNADVANMRWLTTPEMAGKLAQTQRFGSTDTPLWEGNFSDGTLIGYGASTTNQISKTMNGLLDTGGSQHGIVFGNWAELMIGLFGALDLLLDPYTSADKQIIKVHSYQMADVAAKHAESFCVSTGATP